MQEEGTRGFASSQASKKLGVVEAEQGRAVRWFGLDCCRNDRALGVSSRCEPARTGLLELQPQSRLPWQISRSRQNQVQISLAPQSCSKPCLPPHYNRNALVICHTTALLLQLRPLLPDSTSVNRLLFTLLDRDSLSRSQLRNSLSTHSIGALKPSSCRKKPTTCLSQHVGYYGSCLYQGPSTANCCSLPPSPTTCPGRPGPEPH